MDNVLDRFKLTDKVAIVTGAGKGIGKGIALALAEAGAHVVCLARTASDIEETAELVRARGRRALAVHYLQKCGNEGELPHFLKTRWLIRSIVSAFSAECSLGLLALIKKRSTTFAWASSVEYKFGRALTDALHFRMGFIEETAMDLIRVMQHLMGDKFSWDAQC